MAGVAWLSICAQFNPPVVSIAFDTFHLALIPAMPPVQGSQPAQDGSTIRFGSSSVQKGIATPMLSQISDPTRDPRNLTLPKEPLSPLLILPKGPLYDH
jgi:hypothetical protein